LPSHQDVDLSAMVLVGGMAQPGPW